MCCCRWIARLLTMSLPVMAQERRNPPQRRRLQISRNQTTSPTNQNEVHRHTTEGNEETQKTKTEGSSSEQQTQRRPQHGSAAVIPEIGTTQHPSASQRNGAGRRRPTNRIVHLPSGAPLPLALTKLGAPPSSARRSADSKISRALVSISRPGTQLRRTFGRNRDVLLCSRSQQPSASTRRNAGSFTKARYTRSAIKPPSTTWSIR